MLKQAKHKLQGRLKFQGLEISIENRKGSTRKWLDPHGNEKGSTLMRYSYGYIRKTEGTDGDHVDVYIGPMPDAKMAYVIDQNKKIPDSTKGDGKAWTKFDEQKVMLGFPNAKAAKDAYNRQYDDPRFFRSLRAMTMEDFRVKVLTKANHGKKVAALRGSVRAGVRGALPGIGAMAGIAAPWVGAALHPEAVVPTTGAMVIGAVIGAGIGTGVGLGLGKISRSRKRARGKTAEFLDNPNDPFHTPPTQRHHIPPTQRKKRKHASGDMIEYFNKHPQKYKEYKERQARKRLTKKAAMAYQKQIDPIAFAEHQGIKLAQEYWDSRTEMEKVAIKKLLARAAKKIVGKAVEGGKKVVGKVQAVRTARRYAKTSPEAVRAAMATRREAAAAASKVPRTSPRPSPAPTRSLQDLSSGAGRGGSGGGPYRGPAKMPPGRNPLSPPVLPPRVPSPATSPVTPAAFTPKVKAVRRERAVLRMQRMQGKGIVPGSKGTGAPIPAPAAAAGPGLLSARNVLGAGAVAAGGLAIYGGVQGINAAGNMLSRQPRPRVVPRVPGIGRPY